MINFEFVSDTLRIYFDGAGSTGLQTTAVYRDPSAWYHLILAYDSTQATASNRAKLYVNGVQVTAFSSANYPALNQAINAASTNIQLLGATIGPTNFFSGYMTEVNFIDGQALTPSSFGETDTNTGVWKPKAYTGTYGTNGFFLKFADNSNTTAATLGKDSSGNGNNWTPNNFSVTAGAGNDSLVDSPTSYGTDTGVGGEVRGNYCTLNGTSIGANATLSNGNLDISYGSSATRNATMGTFGMSSGKWYWETTIVSLGTPSIGITNTPSPSDVSNYPGFAANGWSYLSDGTKYNSGTGVAYGATYTTNDVIGVAFDADTRELTFYKNGVSQGVAYTGLAVNTYFPAFGDGSAAGTWSGSTNFGQRPFQKWNGSAFVANTAPSGFKALCTQNLPTPTIVDGGEYFDTVLRTGTGTADGQSQVISNLAFTPDLVWNKARSNAFNHNLVDSVRGNDALLLSNSTNAETSVGTTGTQLQITANGFTAIQRVSYNATNQNGVTYAAWNWKANGAGSSNTAGTITSTVSANTTSGFSIVTYTGTSANATVGHGLGAIPAMIMVKNRDSGAIGGAVYHTSMGATKYLKLFQTTTGTDGETTDNTAWNGSSPTFNTNVFSVGSLNRTNSSQQMVAYCFAPVIGYSAFGSYTGNASADGPFVYLGFRPAYVLIKRSSATEAWCVMDSKREGYNVDNDPLFANLANAEGTQDFLDLLSNGFKLRSTDTGVNGSGTYIYACFAESPFKYSLAR